MFARQRTLTPNPPTRGDVLLLRSSLSLSSLELSDTQVYEPSKRALLGTSSDFCEVEVLKLRTIQPGATSVVYLVEWGDDPGGAFSDAITIYTGSSIQVCLLLYSRYRS